MHGQAVHIGNRRLMREVTGADIPTAVDERMAELEASGNTAMLAHAGQRYLGVIAVRDVARAEAAATLRALAAEGIEVMVMLTGDNQLVADAVAQEIGITDPQGGLLPEDKVAAIERLRERDGGVAMIGDGVNDAPCVGEVHRRDCDGGGRLRRRARDGGRGADGRPGWTGCRLRSG